MNHEHQDDAPTIIRCPKCGEQLVFTSDKGSELNDHFVEKEDETRAYIWPRNIRPFDQQPSNAATLRRLRAERTEAAKSGNRRVEIHRNAVLRAFMDTHRGDFKRPSVDLATSISLTCFCGEVQIVGGADEIC